jgi:hypothetical protein
VKCPCPFSCTILVLWRALPLHVVNLQCSKNEISEWFVGCRLRPAWEPEPDGVRLYVGMQGGFDWFRVSLGSVSLNC